MSQLNLESITDQVRALIQRDIEDGKLAPGTRIYEEQLARELRISKTPLRIAIHQLKQVGIIRIEPRLGIYVTLPTMKEVMELLEMREVLEGLAARRAAYGSDDQNAQDLRDCLAGFDESNLAENRIEYAAADHRFHQRLVEASGSAELISTLQVINIRLHMNRLRSTAARQHDLRPLHREHLAIIDAIEAGDSDQAQILASAHVRGVPWQSVLRESGTVASESDLPSDTPTKMITA